MKASPLDRPLWMTQFSSVTRKRGVRERASLREFRTIVRATSAARKEDLPLFKLALFEDNLRSNATLRTIHGVEGDYDGEAMTFSEAARRLEAAHVAAFLYSSASSKPGAPRWRVLCPTSRPLEAERQSGLLARVNGVLGGVLAPESFNPSQAYFLGCVGGSEPRMRCVNGRYIDRCDDLDDGSVGKQRSSKRKPNATDVDRSAVLFRLACEHIRSGKTEDEFERSASVDRDAAGHLRDRSDRKRALQRAWAAAQKAVLIGGGDVENGRAFAARYAGELLYVHKRKQWLQWVGSRWTSCDKAEHVAAAKELASIAVEAASHRFRETPEANDEKRLKATAALYKDRRKLESMLAMAQSEPAIAATPEEFDRDPWLFGVQNGVVNLNTNELVTVDSSQKITRSSRASFDADARCPRFRQFLKRVLPDSEIRRLVQRLVGYSMVGVVDEEVFVFLHGEGENGKSILANILAELFGDYRVTSSSDLVVKTKYSSEYKREVFRLPGARLALINEVARDDVWDDKKVKDVTSRERIAVRELFKEGSDFMPSHTVWMRGNHLPGSRDAGRAFWRRMIPIHFGVRIPKEEQVADLDRRILDDEISGILNWALEGVAEWRSGGLAIPGSIQAAREKYRSDTDDIGRWLAERTIRDFTARTRRKTAYESYLTYCAEHGIAPDNQGNFKRDMENRGYDHKGSTSGGLNWSGLRLKPHC